MKLLTGLKVRKALELEVNVEDIFRVSTEGEGESAAREIYEDEITHTSEIENLKDIFNDESFIYYCTPRKVSKVNDSLIAYTYNMYMASIDSDDINVESKISSEKSLEVIFLNTKVLNYKDFLRNIMDAQRFMGKFDKGTFKRRFSGIGAFNMEEYANNHTLISYADLHFLDFYVKDSNIVSTIGNILTANYEKDIIEQREYLSEDEYEKLLDTVKKHKTILSAGINFGLK